MQCLHSTGLGKKAVVNHHREVPCHLVKYDREQSCSARQLLTFNGIQWRNLGRVFAANLLHLRYQNSRARQNRETTRGHFLRLAGTVPNRIAPDVFVPSFVLLRPLCSFPRPLTPLGIVMLFYTCSMIGTAAVIALLTYTLWRAKEKSHSPKLRSARASHLFSRQLIATILPSQVRR